MPDKITRGPWVVEERKTLNTTYHMIFSGDTKLCEITVGAGLNKPKREKIARLIAAAPDMLRTLDAIESECKDANRNGDIIVPSHIVDLILHTIAKAKGAS